VFVSRICSVRDLTPKFFGPYSNGLRHDAKEARQLNETIVPSAARRATQKFKD
jgi:hypothetical protein